MSIVNPFPTKVRGSLSVNIQRYLWGRVHGWDVLLQNTQGLGSSNLLSDGGVYGLNVLCFQISWSWSRDRRHPTKFLPLRPTTFFVHLSTVGRPGSTVIQKTPFVSSPAVTAVRRARRFFTPTRPDICLALHMQSGQRCASSFH